MKQFTGCIADLVFWSKIYFLYSLPEYGICTVHIHAQAIPYSGQALNKADNTSEWIYFQRSAFP